MGRKVELWDKTYKCGGLEVSGPIQGLHTWHDAMKLALPPGWRVANDADWDKIKEHFNGNALKFIAGLGIEMDGYMATNGTFFNFGTNAYLWSSSVYGAYAWYRALYSGGATVARVTSTKALGFSVRCVRDIESQ